MQLETLLYSPQTGKRVRELYTAKRWRELNPQQVWHFNPFTGKARHHSDIFSDSLGFLIVHVK